MKTVGGGSRPDSPKLFTGQRQKRVVKLFTKEEVQKANGRVKSPNRSEAHTRRRRSRSPSRMREVTGKKPVGSGLRAVIKSVAEKRRKAQERQRKYEKRLRATHGERSLLEMGSVKKAQRLDYAKRLEQFYLFVAHYQLPVSDEKELDEALCDYADFLYLDGNGHDAGEKLKAALEFERPEASRHGDLKLPRFRRAMKGWRKMAPSQTRLPMIEFIKGAISAVMLDRGWKEMALYNEVSFSTYARPGELIRVQVADVVSRNKDYDHDVIILSPFERQEGSKTGIYDEVLILDDLRMTCLGPLVVELAKEKERKYGADCPLWGFNSSQYLKVWRACVRSLDVENLAQSPYQNRHGGASRDHLLRLRSVPAIQRRGRWAADASARIYDKPGRLQQAINSVSDKYMKLGEEMRVHFATYFRGGKVQLPVALRRAVLQNFKD
jgi:hypothetical protein